MGALLPDPHAAEPGAAKPTRYVAVPSPRSAPAGLSPAAPSRKVFFLWGGGERVLSSSSRTHAAPGSDATTADVHPWLSRRLGGGGHGTLAVLGPSVAGHRLSLSPSASAGRGDASRV